MQEKRLTIVEHLSELRSRLIKGLIAVLLCSCITYNFVDRLLPFIIKPVGKVVFIAPQEAFVTNIKLSFLGGLFLASPYIIFQIWRFISAGLRDSEKKYVLLFAPFSFLLFLVGSGFGYFVVIPIGIKFLLGFATEVVTPMITLSRYISFIGLLTFMFGIVFLLPLIVLFLTKLGVLTPDILRSKRRHAIVLIFILSALITPPDVVTQLFLGLPLVVLYEIGIIFSRLAYRRI